MPPSKDHLNEKISQLGYYGEGELVVEQEPLEDIMPLSPGSLAALRRLARYRPPPDIYPFPDGRAAVMVALFGSRSGEKLNVLLSTRSKTLRTYAGQVALPGGRMDLEDINLVATARREAWEEVGMPLDETAVRYLTTLPPFLARNLVLVTPVVFFVLDSSLKPDLNPAEVEEVFSFPLVGFLADKVEAAFSKSVPPEVLAGQVPYHTSQDFTWLRTRSRFHAFQSAPAPVTGLTANILISVAKIAYGRAPDFEEVGTEEKDRRGVVEEGMKEPEWASRIAAGGREKL